MMLADVRTMDAVNGPGGTTKHKNRMHNEHINLETQIALKTELARICRGSSTYEGLASVLGMAPA
jgi:hypothetical protein